MIENKHWNSQKLFEYISVGITPRKFHNLGLDNTILTFYILTLYNWIHLCHYLHIPSHTNTFFIKIKHMDLPKSIPSSRKENQRTIKQSLRYCWILILKFSKNPLIRQIFYQISRLDATKTTTFCGFIIFHYKKLNIIVRLV